MEGDEVDTSADRDESSSALPVECNAAIESQLSEETKVKGNCTTDGIEATQACHKMGEEASSGLMTDDKDEAPASMSKVAMWRKMMHYRKSFTSATSHLWDTNELSDGARRRWRIVSFITAFLASCGAFQMWAFSEYLFSLKVQFGYSQFQGRSKQKYSQLQTTQ